MICVFLWQWTFAEENYTLDIGWCPIPDGSAPLWERIPEIDPECLQELRRRDSINIYLLDSRLTPDMKRILPIEWIRHKSADAHRDSLLRATMDRQHSYAKLPGEAIYFSINGRNEIYGLYYNDSLIYTFLTDVSPSDPVPEAFTVENHWVLRHRYYASKASDLNRVPTPAIITTKHTIVIDGEDLCNKYGYDNCYAFRYLNDKPFFIFEREGHVGCSYDGKEYSTPFDEVWHDRCCDEARIGIGFGPHYANFVAHNPADSTWYKVVARLVRQ